MSNKSMIVLLASLLTFISLSFAAPLTSSAHRRDAEGVQPKLQRGERAQRRKMIRLAKLYRFDSNRDGKLQANERAVIKQQFDGNRDGKLDRQERKALRQALRAK
jgi:EF hand